MEGRTECKVFKAVDARICDEKYLTLDIHNKIQRVHYNIFDAVKYMFLEYIRAKYDGFVIFTHDHNTCWISLRGAEPFDGKDIVEDLKNLDINILQADGYYITRDTPKSKTPEGYETNSQGEVYLDKVLVASSCKKSSLMDYFGGLSITITFLDNYHVVYRMI